jgi:hypothetical protein
MSWMNTVIWITFMNATPPLLFAITAAVWMTTDVARVAPDPYLSKSRWNCDLMMYTRLVLTSVVVVSALMNGGANMKYSVRLR